ncbi:MAG: HTH-type transcriptional activator RhaS [Syntrophaceae bacterium PtaU1.Bin231]|nr:MAG: HTH-type transcriptional activator RhaS [Syntrophaceae bacterium PtaU1.Bin231]
MGRIYLGGSSFAPGVSCLRELYRQACAALKECRFQGKPLCVFPQINRRSRSVITPKDYFRLLNCLIFEKEQELYEALSAMLQRITSDKSLCFEDAKREMYGIVNYIQAELMGTHPNVCDASAIRARLDTMCHASEMKFYVREVVGEIYQAVHCVEGDSAGYIINYIVNYVKQNYRGKVSLSVLANELNINYYYLSTLFKKKTNITFSEYIRKVRLENARELLQGSNLKIYEIAARCGYYDGKLFHKEFRKAFDCSPSQYREKKQPAIPQNNTRYPKQTGSS